MATRSEPGAEHHAAAWLVLDAGAEPPVVSALSRPDCLTVAGAVLVSAAGKGQPYGPPPSLAERLSLVSGRVPALAEWLATAAQEEGGLLDGFLEKLAAALVMPGDERWPAVAAGGFPVAEAAVLRDAVQTALKLAQLQGRFQQAVAEARLEAMRELAYGAGHEINNPLANIATRAQALLLEESDPERRRRLSTIVDQSFRARDMIGGLMLFARPPKPRPEPIDVGAIVTAVIEATRPQAAMRTVRLEYSPLPSPVSVHVDRVQIEEAVRVVVINAIESVALGGRVVLEAIRRSPDDGGWCEINVVDDGRGMSVDAARRAFDPFFSGREAGRGAGLGLSKAWRLVELNGGRVLLDSRPGRGTRVSLLLPEASATVVQAVSADA
ncbi:MAG: sensor histidine kinase [Planctomycetia bacterium]